MPRDARPDVPADAPHRPRKRLGQHFLTDPSILGRIADAVAATPDDTVLEIGAGPGGLTKQLVARAGRVIAIELDPNLAARLRATYADNSRVQILEGDALDVDFAAVAGPGYLIAANVPYYITTPLLFHALATPRPKRGVFLVQREVAERIASPPGSKAYGALSVMVQSVADAALLFRVAPGAFHPPPTVDSTLIRVTPLATPLVGESEEAAFRVFVQGAFGFRRKQMRRVLRTLADCSPQRAEELLALAEIDPDVRPETISPTDFARLFHAVDRRSP